MTTKILIAALAILALALAGAGAGLWKQIRLNGEQKVRIDTLGATVKAQETARKASDAALQTRDQDLARARQENDRYKARLRALEAKDAAVADWYNRPLPRSIIVFMCERTHSDSETCLSIRDSAPGPPAPEMGR
jgi:type II secretory pathway pseudopilin PulG